MLTTREFTSQDGVKVSVNSINVTIQTPGARYPKRVKTESVDWATGEEYCRLFYGGEEILFMGGDVEELVRCLENAEEQCYESEQFKQTLGKRSPREERQSILPAFSVRIGHWTREVDILSGTSALLLKGTLVPIVLLHGAQKYPFYSWRNLPLDEAKDKYQDAFWRHYLPEIFYPEDGPEWKDKETGMHHWAHAAACMFILKDLNTQLEIDEEFLEIMSERVKL